MTITRTTRMAASPGSQKEERCSDAIMATPNSNIIIGASSTQLQQDLTAMTQLHGVNARWQMKDLDLALRFGRSCCSPQKLDYVSHVALSSVPRLLLAGSNGLRSQLLESDVRGISKGVYHIPCRNKQGIWNLQLRHLQDTQEWYPIREFPVVNLIL
jgi:hypothetical protein